MSAELTDRIDRWVDRGLITREQAERILADEQATASPETPAPAAPAIVTPSLVTEALGYVGGVLVLVAAAMITGRFWSELGTGGRLAVAVAAAVLLLAAGAAAPERMGAAGARLRGVSWLLSAATCAAALALVGNDVLDVPGDATALIAFSGTSVYAAVLWYLHRRVLQHAALVTSLAVAAAAAAALLPSGSEEVAGLAAWGVGVVWLLLGWGGVVAARRAAYVCGGAVVVVGAVLTVSEDWGCVLIIASAVVLVAVGVVQRDLVLLGVGAVATLLAVPIVMSRYFPDTLVPPFALLAVGALLVLGAIYTARRRGRAAGTAGREREGGTPRPAVVAAAAVAIVVLVAVLVMGTASPTDVVWPG